MTLKHILLYIACCLLLIGTGCQAQDFSITALPTQRLLPTASIHCIFQDSEGYVWYGTDEGGLCRDNGYQIDILRPTQAEYTRGALHVHWIAEDGNGNILFSTDAGLFTVDKRDYSVHHVELDATDATPGFLFTDSHGNTWIGTHGKIFVRNADGQITATHKCLSDGKPASPASFYEDSRGQMFVLQWNGGVLMKKGGEHDFHALTWPLAETPLQMLEDAANQCYWVLTSGAGVVRMEVNGSRCEVTAQASTLGNIQRNRGLSMLRDSQTGLLWVTTHDGLYAYSIDRHGTLHSFPLGAYIPEGGMILDQLYESRSGDIYVAGYTPHSFIISSAKSDIVRLPIDAIRRQTGFPLLADRSVHDGNRYIWIWQGRNGLMLYDRQTDKAEVVPVRADRTIQRSSLGGLWASSGARLFRLWQENGKIMQEDIAQTAEGSHISCLVETEGRTLYVATGTQLYRLSIIGRQLQTIAAMPAPPVDMAADKHGNIYVACGIKGLFNISQKGAVKQIDAPVDDYLSVCVQPDGTIWASSAEGRVYHSATEQMVQEPLLCNTESAAVKYIRADGLGHVWTMTDQRVCEYTPQSHAFRAFENTAPFVDVSYFYALEQIDATHICIDGAGALLEVQSSAELSQQNSSQIMPRLSSVLVGSERRLVGRDATRLPLAAGEEDLTLHLTTLDHLHASDISFAYQLEGLNRDWVYLPQGTNSIVLTNLSKGSHRLRIMATDCYGCWSQPADVITIHRAAHWWETWWAYIIYLCIAIAVGYNVWRLERRIHLLHRLIRRKEAVRLDEIEMKREDIDALKRDDEVLRRAISTIEEHLAEKDFNVEALADEMCMSRITLYRRLQELTGQSPTELIRDIRLKKAAQLIQQSPNATIADIARKVGFATPKYFSKCFKDKFGVLPKEYHM